MLSIDEAVGNRIRRDSVASIGTIGVLGDSYIEISVGTLNVPVLPPGAEIEAVNPTNLYEVMAHASAAMDSIATLTDNLDSEVMVHATKALDGVTTLAANLDSLVNTFAEEGGGQKAAHAVDAVAEMMLAIKEGDGLLHDLIFDDESGKGLGERESLPGPDRKPCWCSSATSSPKVQEGNGLVHSLISTAPPPNAMSSWSSSRPAPASTVSWPKSTRERAPLECC